MATNPFQMQRRSHLWRLITGVPLLIRATPENHGAPTRRSISAGRSPPPSPPPLRLMNPALMFLGLTPTHQQGRHRGPHLITRDQFPSGGKQSGTRRQKRPVCFCTRETESHFNLIPRLRGRGDWTLSVGQIKQGH